MSNRDSNNTRMDLEKRAKMAYKNLGKKYQKLKKEKGHNVNGLYGDEEENTEYISTLLARKILEKSSFCQVKYSFRFKDSEDGDKLLDRVEEIFDLRSLGSLHKDDSGEVIYSPPERDYN